MLKAAGRGHIRRPHQAVAQHGGRDVGLDPVNGGQDAVPEDETLGDGAEHEEVGPDKVKQEYRLRHRHPDTNREKLRYFYNKISIVFIAI